MKRFLSVLTLVLFVLTTSFSQQTQEARLLRFPNIHGNKVVFSYAGDLYEVNINGGVARRLTSDPGYEMFAKFSPDGKWIAFTAQYDGNTEVYVMPADGGVPRRLTYTATLNRDDVSDRMGPNNIVMGWTPDSKKIVFRSRMYSFNSFRGQLFLVDLKGDMPQEIPLLDGGFCSFSPDGSKLAFNRIFREFRTWKHYRGGMADDIWIYDFKTGKAHRLFKNPAQDIFPMWYKDKIFFLSDRDWTMNLYVYDLKTHKTTKLTNFTKYDIKFPSIGGDKIVFENGGYLYYYDIPTGKLHKITVYIKNDFASTRNHLVDASKYIESSDISPNGKKVVFSARGDIFVVNAKDGLTQNITKTQGVFERDVVWSPDGKYVAYLSDKDGKQYEIFIQKADGSEPPIQISTGAKTYYFKLKWSPDSKKLLFNDELLNLKYIDVKTHKITQVDKGQTWEITEFNWSPDSRWIVYIKPTWQMLPSVWIYDTKTGEKHQVTDGWYSCSDPSFSSDGKYLVFVSDRDFHPIYSDVEWNFAYKDMERPYIMLLTKNAKDPFAPSENYPQQQNSNKQQNAKTPEVKIDFNGISNRIVQVPVRPANYWDLHMIGDKLYYIGSKFNDDHSHFYMYDLKKQKEVELGQDLSFKISANNKKMLIKQGKKYAVIDLPSAPVKISKWLDLSNMKLWVNYQAEWHQIFNDVWRQMKDFFYDPNMHGFDWNAIYKKYAVLLPYVHHRDDLTYILGEMIGELNIGHAYVGGGDRPKIKRLYTGLLGARFKKDPKTGYFVVTKILQGANWSKQLYSPLQDPSVNVHLGDYILAIDGTPTNTVNNIYKLLVAKGGKLVKLTVNSQPSFTNSRNVVVRTLKSEANLLYYDWVQHNIKYVSEKTNGQVGYLHIPDMETRGLNQFVKYFYPQIHKKALIVDERGNGGGNVSPMIIERLRRQMIMQQMARNIPTLGPVPEQTLVGPKVLLINMYTASDGDLFAYQFKHYHIGPVIGTRTWGGVTGIRGSLPLIDGGYLYKPEFGHYSADGTHWIVEGHGVDPDIQVINNPADYFRGKDAQLDKAIEVIKKLMKTYPQKITPHPPFPNKNYGPKQQNK